MPLTALLQNLDTTVEGFAEGFAATVKVSVAVYVLWRHHSLQAWPVLCTLCCCGTSTGLDIAR